MDTAGSPEPARRRWKRNTVLKVGQAPKDGHTTGAANEQMSGVHSESPRHREGHPRSEGAPNNLSDPGQNAPGQVFPLHQMRSEEARPNAGLGE